MKAYGIDRGMLLRTVPIKTVGLPPLEKYKVWLFDQRRVVVESPYLVPSPTGGGYIIPAGFEFDGGSIPRWLLVLVVLLVMLHLLPPLVLLPVMVGLLIERFGLMLNAFAVHDFAVRYQMLINEHGEIVNVLTVRDANSKMRRVNFATNDMILIGLVAHAAVVLGAWRAWNQYRKGKRATVDWRTLNYGVTLQT